MYINYNPNPIAARVGDCAVRALCRALDQEWDKTYIDMCIYGLINSDMPSANHVWGRMLKDNGFTRYIVPDSCPDCYTVEGFLSDHKEGIYVIGTNGHVLTAIDGNYYDTWDSGSEVPIYYWHKEG